METDNKIYVDLIDGTNVWVPIKTKKLDDSKFLILEIDEFDKSDTTRLLEFFPGDTVEIAEHTFMNGEVGMIAKKLVEPSTLPSRKYFDFLYKVLQKKIPFDKHTYETYKQEIARVKKDSLTGQYFYPDILKNINEIESVGSIIE